MTTRRTQGIAGLAFVVMWCSMLVNAGEMQQFEAYLNRYVQGYQVVAFDGNRVRALRSRAAEARYETSLRQESTMMYGDIEVHHRIDVSLYTYANKEARDAALGEWLDRFSILGDPIRINENRRHVKSPPLFALVTDSSVLVLSTRCETVGEEWDRNIRDAESIFGHPEDLTLRVGCGGPVQWGRLQETTPN